MPVKKVAKKATKKAATKNNASVKKAKKTKKTSPVCVDNNISTESDNSAIFVPSNLKVYQTDDAISAYAIDNTAKEPQQNISKSDEPANKDMLTADNKDTNNAAFDKLSDDEQPAPTANNAYKPYPKEYKNDSNIIIAILVFSILSMLAFFAF